MEQPHADPEFYEKYEFCRRDCPECDRLDRIEATTMSFEERLAKAARMVGRAMEAGESW